MLCFILIGIFVYFYMLIVKPDGTLTVTYELRATPEALVEDRSPVKVARRPCPRCAELILPAALVCRFCFRELPQGWAGEFPVPRPAARTPAASGALHIGSRVRRTANGPVGEVIAIEDEAITVRWSDNRSSAHLRHDLKPL